MTAPSAAPKSDQTLKEEYLRTMAWFPPLDHIFPLTYPRQNLRNPAQPDRRLTSRRRKSSANDLHFTPFLPDKDFPIGVSKHESDFETITWIDTSFLSTKKPLLSEGTLFPTSVPRHPTLQIRPDLDAQILTALPFYKTPDPVKQNRMEFIAELFIIILTTRADMLSLVPRVGPSTTTSKPENEEQLYEFKHTLPPSNSLLRFGEDLFSCMYKPQAALTTTSSISGRYSRFWRMAIASLILRDGIPELFNSSIRNFEFLYDNLHDLASYTLKGCQMTAVGSKKALFDIVCSYTIVVGTDYQDESTKSKKKKRIDYLEGMEEYEKQLFIYMAQLGAYFLIPERPDPLEVLRNGTHPALRGILETPCLDPASLSNGTPVLNAADELREIKYFLKSVDKGVLRPNLSEIKKQSIQLPSVLPVR